jgi:hypothetical protein
MSIIKYRVAFNTDTMMVLVERQCMIYNASCKFIYDLYFHYVYALNCQVGHVRQPAAHDIARRTIEYRKERLIEPAVHVRRHHLDNS